VKSELGPPMTLGNAAGDGVGLIVWCRECSHQVEPDPAEMADRYGAETMEYQFADSLVCSRSGSRQDDMVVTGAERLAHSQGTTLFVLLQPSPSSSRLSLPDGELPLSTVVLSVRLDGQLTAIPT
jgi:hypothetical protein